jgi:hypothetical protein
LTEGGRTNNFAWFNLRKSFLRLGVSLDPTEPWEKLLQNVGLDFKNRHGELRIELTTKDVAENSDLIRKILREAVEEDDRQ